MKTWLLASFLLVFQVPEGAWGSEPSAAEAAEEEGEHELTGKERRAARRERRRQRREARRQARHTRHASGSADENGFIEADPDPEAEEETEQSLQKGMDKAGGNAQKLGDLLKKTLNNTPEDLPMGQSLGQALTGGSLGAGGGKRSAGSDASPVSVGDSPVKSIKIPDVANPDPKNKQDLLAAVRSGFGESLVASGLKLGSDSRGKTTIVSADGSPAGQNQLDTLAEHIAKEPVMLTKRPDFFKVLPRRKFQDLKQDIKQPEPGGEGVFKDVALTEGDRDFAWSQTCGGVSGGCNSYVKSSSYRGGDYVEPEDLGRLWSSVHESGASTASAQPTEEKRVNARSIRSKLNVVLGAIKQVFIDTKGEKSGGAGGVSGRGSSVAGVFLGMFDWSAKTGKQVVYADVQKKGQTVVPGEADLATPVATSLPPEKAPAAGMGLGLAVVGLAALVFKRALG